MILKSVMLSSMFYFLEHVKMETSDQSNTDPVDFFVKGRDSLDTIFSSGETFVYKADRSSKCDESCLFKEQYDKIKEYIQSITTKTKSDGEFLEIKLDPKYRAVQDKEGQKCCGSCYKQIEKIQENLMKMMSSSNGENIFVLNVSGVEYVLGYEIDGNKLVLIECLKNGMNGLLGMKVQILKDDFFQKMFQIRDVYLRTQDHFCKGFEEKLKESSHVRLVKSSEKNIVSNFLRKEGVSANQKDKLGEKDIISTFSEAVSSVADLFSPPKKANPVIESSNRTAGPAQKDINGKVPKSTNDKLLKSPKSKDVKKPNSSKGKPLKTIKKIK